LIELIEKYPKYEIPTKFEVAIDLTKKLMSEGKKVLLWTTFIHNIDMLRERLKDLKYFTIHGAIPRDDNENESFNREKEYENLRQAKSRVC
jgi:SNF2 family DNA or RNA helicase